MSLKAIKEVLEHARLGRDAPPELDALAAAQMATLERAAKDLTRLHLGDGVYDVAHRDHVIAAMTDDPASQWNHPDVKAWSDAAQLLATIATEAQ